MGGVGSGRKKGDIQTCPWCKGDGEIKLYGYGIKVCPQCHGDGWTGDIILAGKILDDQEIPMEGRMAAVTDENGTRIVEL